VPGRAIEPLIANAMPGWFDPRLTIYDSKGEQVAYADDFRIRPEPVILFEVPKEGITRSRFATLSIAAVRTSFIV
jgi:hypothetical protein